MKKFVRTGLVAFSVFNAGFGNAWAQTNQDSAQKDSAADQFKAGAQHIGEGATRIGEGIKQGAIQTWEAVKAGAEAAADKLKGQPAAPKQSHPSASPSGEAH